MVFDHGEKILREEIGKYFNLKENSIVLPDVYLGVKMRLVKLEKSSKVWAFRSSQYLVEFVKNVEAYLARKENNINAKSGAPISDGYRPETEATIELRPVDSAYYRSLIGILRWMVELVRFDIFAEVSMISS